MEVIIGDGGDEIFDYDYNFTYLKINKKEKSNKLYF